MAINGEWTFPDPIHLWIHQTLPIVPRNYWVTYRLLPMIDILFISLGPETDWTTCLGPSPQMSMLKSSPPKPRSPLGSGEVTKSWGLIFHELGQDPYKWDLRVLSRSFHPRRTQWQAGWEWMRNWSKADTIFLWLFDLGPSAPGTSRYTFLLRLSVGYTECYYESWNKLTGCPASWAPTLTSYPLTDADEASSLLHLEP